MFTLKDIINYIEAKAGHSLHSEEGPQFGNINQSLTGVTVCWDACPEAILSAAEKGNNLLICHESLTNPWLSFKNEKERPVLTWPTNAQRLTLLAQNNIMVCRMHGTLDELFIYKAFCEQIAAVKVLSSQRQSEFAKIYSIKPTRYADLIDNVKKATAMQGLRATNGNPERIIKTIGVPWGGLGLFVNVWYQQSLIELGHIDAMVCGETDNFGMRFCKEIGIDVIETSHEISENFGLEIFSKDLANHFKQLKIVFFKNEKIWQVY